MQHKQNQSSLQTIVMISFVFQADFDTNCELLELKSKGNEAKESICKLEFTVDKDKRIIVFTTNLLLKYLAGARGLSIDGTFKSTPKGWSQILIISAEICKDEWVPVVYIWLPDKCFETYEMAFRLVKNLLDKLGLVLSGNAD